MTKRKLSATDTALRERITELSVHIPCGWLRGPVRRTPHGGFSARWQSCPDEDSLKKWGQGRLLVVWTTAHHSVEYRAGFAYRAL